MHSIAVPIPDQNGWMMPEEQGNITRLLHQWRAGEHSVESHLFDLVVPDRLAHYIMRRERPDHSMQPTELVDQIYFRLVAAKNQDWQNRRHFFAIAARAMRRYLIDHARGRPEAEFVALNGIEKLLPAGSSTMDLAITVDRLFRPSRGFDFTVPLPYPPCHTLGFGAWGPLVRRLRDGFRAYEGRRTV